MRVPAPVLLIAAHGTRSPTGRATITRLATAVAAARPDVSVALCFLDVVESTLAATLAAATGPVVVVPLLLSAGYHVLVDIPALAAEHPQVRVADHLGPDPRVVDALVDRLVEARRPDSAPRTTLLARVGSTRAAADAEVAVARELLGQRLGRGVQELRVTDDGPDLATLSPPIEIASYVLAEGDLLDRIRAVVGAQATVADPLGAHPAIVELVLARYDAVVAHGG